MSASSSPHPPQMYYTLAEFKNNFKEKDQTQKLANILSLSNEPFKFEATQQYGYPLSV